MADRRHDFDFIVCANRKLQGSERSGAAKITISFDVGNPIKFDFPRSSASFYGTRFQDRCFIYAEWEWQSRRWNLFDIETDKRFRPEHLKKLTFERTIHHKFEDDTMETALLPSVEFYINPDFKWWTEESDSVGVKIPITDELIDARMRGEAAYYAKICKNIELLSPIKTPDDADKSTYAKGFTIGWKMAQEMLRTESNRDATCKLLPEVFDIAQSKTPRLFRVKGAR